MPKKQITKFENKEDDFDPILSIDEDLKNIQNMNNDIGDLYQLSNKFYDLLNIKIAFLLFLIYYILNTDIFIELAFSNNFIKNVYDRTNDKITEKGIVISGIILSMCYLVIDMLNKKNII
jgi:hypothetical protein